MLQWIAADTALAAAILYLINDFCLINATFKNSQMTIRNKKHVCVRGIIINWRSVYISWFYIIYDFPDHVTRYTISDKHFVANHRCLQTAVGLGKFVPMNFLSISMQLNRSIALVSSYDWIFDFKTRVVHDNTRILSVFSIDAFLCTADEDPSRAVRLSETKEKGKISMAGELLRSWFVRWYVVDVTFIWHLRVESQSRRTSSPVKVRDGLSVGW